MSFLTIFDTFSLIFPSFLHFFTYFPLFPPQDHYSNNPGSDRLNEVRGEIAAVKDVMVQNIGTYHVITHNFPSFLIGQWTFIEKVLERGERMELLVDKTDTLNQQAFQFKKKSTQLKRAMWWKNTKLMVILAFVVIVVLYLIVCFACGFPAWHNCVGGGEEGANRRNMVWYGEWIGIVLFIVFLVSYLVCFLIFYGLVFTCLIFIVLFFLFDINFFYRLIWYLSSILLSYLICIVHYCLVFDIHRPRLLIVLCYSLYPSYCTDGHVIVPEPTSTITYWAHVGAAPLLIGCR